MLLLLLLLMSAKSFAQDSLHTMADSLPKAKEHSPTIAAVASAILPGAGQVYNRKYWKVPIVYAGLATAAYFIYLNGNIYYSVRNNLNSRVAGDSIPTPETLVVNTIFSKTTINLNSYSYDDLISLEDDYRKYFTISIIAGGAVYFLNILDAVVDAHLFHFDVGDDLSLDVHPQLFNALGAKPAPGFSMFLTIK